jgi:hypothetical protein
MTTADDKKPGNWYWDLHKATTWSWTGPTEDKQTTPPLSIALTHLGCPDSPFRQSVRSWPPEAQYVPLARDAALYLAVRAGAQP